MKAPPMPNNQDAVKQGWRFDPYPWRVTNNVGQFIAISGSPELAGVKGNTFARAFIHALNEEFPTPREQELEAQNKALWELVEKAHDSLTTCITSMDGMDFEREKDIEAFAKYQAYSTNKAREVISEIQKAKEAR